MKKVIIASLLSTTCFSTLAHDIWIKADSHEINNDEQKVFALDVSRSGQTYIAEANHDIKHLNMTAPNGQSKTFNADYSGKVKEVFEVEFNESGTYHFESPMTQVFLTFYFDEEGKKHKIRMPKTKYHTLPKGAKPEKTVEKQIITETYVSFNGFTEVENTNSDGLQITLMQHPNKLRAGKPFGFKLTFNGKPVPEAEVTLKSLNQFYYQDSEEVDINLEEKDQGLVTFNTATPGRYLLGVEFGTQLKNNAKADFRSVEKFLTFEVTQ